MTYEEAERAIGLLGKKIETELKLDYFYMSSTHMSIDNDKYNATYYFFGKDTEIKALCEDKEFPTDIDELQRTIEDMKRSKKDIEEKLSKAVKTVEETRLETLLEGSRMLDGNLAELREYERKVDEADRTYEMFLEDVEYPLQRFRDAITDIYSVAEYFQKEYGYDFEEEAYTLMQEELGV